MPAFDSYQTASSRKSCVLKVKGSRFIAEAFPVASEAEARDTIDRVRTREYNATHHCWAYRIGSRAVISRFSDDGEPSGTAGRPINRQIEARNLTHVLVVVTRYFGGTRLGTGGLSRAYGEAAAAVLDRVRIQTVINRTSVRVTFAYDDTSPAMHTIEQFDAIVETSEYGEGTDLVLGVRISQVESFVDTFRNALSGRCTIEVLAQDPSGSGRPDSGNLNKP